MKELVILGIIDSLLASACKLVSIGVAQRVVAAIVSRSAVDLKRHLPVISQSKELMSEAIAGFDPEIMTLHECATVLTSCRMHEIDDVVFRKRLVISLSQLNAFMTVL